MREGGLDVQVFAVLADRMYAPHRSARRTLQLIDAYHDALAANGEAMALARTAGDVERIVGAGKIAAILGIEGGHAIEDDVGLLRMYSRLGVTVMTLIHMNTNGWADSATDEARSDGLSGLGREVIREMNRLGMVIDVSHASDQTVLDVLETSRHPVIASHTNATALCDHPRNLSDDMIRSLASKGSVICVTTVPAYTSQVFKDAVDALPPPERPGRCGDTRIRRPRRTGPAETAGANAVPRPAPPVARRGSGSCRSHRPPGRHRSRRHRP